MCLGNKGGSEPCETEPPVLREGGHRAALFPAPLGLPTGAASPTPASRHLPELPPAGRAPGVLSPRPSSQPHSQCPAPAGGAGVFALLLQD